jgi:RNA polymerase sigma factor (sigma-70 family)
MASHHGRLVAPTTASDDVLIDRVRRGDTSAFAALWERHVASARTAARAISPRLDPDDLVSETFAAILSALRSGRGPRGPFRPYMFTAIRNTAASWGGRPRDVQLEEIEDVADPGAEDIGDAFARRTLVIDALRTLPPRWQSLLWSLEVEGMKPREVATVMGVSPNAVSALRRRARAGLRRACAGEPAAVGAPIYR